MDYQYLNKLIDLGVEKAIRHQKFNNDETDWCILLSRIRIWSGLCREVGSGSGPKPDRIRNTDGRTKLSCNLHTTYNYPEILWYIPY
jgi:hypothetical protein